MQSSTENKKCKSSQLYTKTERRVVCADKKRRVVYMRDGKPYVKRRSATTGKYRFARVKSAEMHGGVSEELASVAASNRGIKSFLLGLKYKMDTCVFTKDDEDATSSYQGRVEECKNMLNGDTKWKCGYSQSVIKDTIQHNNMIDVIEGKIKQPKDLRGDLDRIFVANAAAVVYVLWYFRGVPYNHAMTWLITNDTAHTLQSWENVSRYKYWSLSIADFNNAVGVLARAKAVDDNYKRMFELLTNIKGDNPVWIRANPKPARGEYMLARQEKWNNTSQIVAPTKYKRLDE